MAFSWLPKWSSRQTPKPKNRCRLGVERLEDRLTPVTSVTTLGGTVTATSLVQSLVGSGVQASNISYTGVNAGAGKFSGGLSSIGFAQGVILSSGDAADVIGNNNNSSAGTSNNVSNNNAAPGDANLDTIVSPNSTFDASVLEFDFVPTGSVLKFQYVFSSEEYPEYVNASYNDVFAFFVNGQNVALLPNSSTTVSIDNVNAGLNAGFFVDNYTSNTPARQITMDGLTTVLTINAAVNPGQVNHIKLAVADAGDSNLDSNVFIKAGSFTSPPAPPAPPKPVIRIYNPVRYLPYPGTRIYYGYFTIANIGNASAIGPQYLIFKKLPRGANIVGASGKTAEGYVYLAVNRSIGAQQSIKVLVRINNPLLTYLYGFFTTQNLTWSKTKPA